MSAFGELPGACPCGSGESYAACCGPLLSAEALAETPEALMRSRYTAYAVGNVAHLLRTWHPDNRPAALDLDDNTVWNGLVIVATEGGAPDDVAGVVEFSASWSGGGRSGRLHEVSRFARRGGRWVYVDGDVG